MSTVNCVHFVYRVYTVHTALLTMHLQEWSDKMSQPMEWVDHIFLTLAAKLLKRDIIIVPCFPENCHYGGDFLRFLGGLREGDLASGQDTAAASPPILLATTEENVFCSGHFQVIATRDVQNILNITLYGQILSDIVID